jgi:hypothetical protein
MLDMNPATCRNKFDKLLQKMKQVIMLNTLNPQLQPTRTFSRGQVITLLPRESALVCIRVTDKRNNFCPQQIYPPLPFGTMCYLIKNTSFTLLTFRNCSLHTLLSHASIQHKMLIVPVETIIQLHKRWLRGYRVWYPLRRMYLLSQHFHHNPSPKL